MKTSHDLSACFYEMLRFNNLMATVWSRLMIQIRTAHNVRRRSLCNGKA